MKELRSLKSKISVIVTAFFAQFIIFFKRYTLISIEMRESLTFRKVLTSQNVVNEAPRVAWIIHQSHDCRCSSTHCEKKYILAWAFITSDLM